MKKLITLSAAALLCGTALSAKTADELRIYINPGHGSWTSNDRPMKIYREVDGTMTTVNPNTDGSNGTPDTTAFYESNTDLVKGLALLDRLESYGLKIDRTKNQDNATLSLLGPARDLSNNLFMSRSKNGPYPTNSETESSTAYNRNLSEICYEVETNNFDMFISIHSNAATDGSTVNYLAMFYRGTSGAGGDRSAGSRDMCMTVWPYPYSVKYHNWTARKTAADAAIGDVSFFGSESESSVIPGCYGYYGVLKHNVPGFLVEGYFHTYQPSRHRAMNFDADRIEGYMYARGIADYFGLTKESTGEIYGLVRDLHERFSGTYYTPMAGTNDSYLPLNGVTVNLLKDGQVVKTVVTDNHYNGAFIFDNVEPGTYTLQLSHPDYKEADENQPLTVEVKAAETAMPEIFLEANDYVAPTETYYDYKDELADEPTVGPSAEYNFTQEYTDEVASEFADLNVRRMIVRNDKAIILAHDSDKKPTIVVRDLKTKEIVRALSTEGTVGSIMTVADVTMTADGYLLAMNADVLPFGGSKVVKVYKWEKDATDGLPTGAPVQIAEFNHAGNWSSAEFGKTITYSGTLDEGYMIAANKSTANNNTRFEYMTFNGGELTAYSHMSFNSMAGSYTDAVLGDYEINVSPINEECFILTSQNVQPMEIKINKASGGVPSVVATLPEGLIQGTGFRANYFKYAGATYMVAPETSADGKCTGVALLDITNGLAKATVVTTTNTSLPEASSDNAPAKSWAIADAGTASAGATVDVTRDATGLMTSSCINLYAVRDAAALTKMTTENTDQPQFRGQYAYDLSMTNSSDIYTLTFKSTGEALNAKVILTNVNNADDVKTIEVGEVKPGENTVTVDASTFDEGAEYNWAVEIDSKPVPSTGRLFAARTTAWSTNTRGGVQVMDDPEEASFGKVVVSQGNAKGIEVYNPDLTLQGTYLTGNSPWQSGNTSSTFRAGQRNGKAYLSDWSDQGAGYWIFDTENPNTVTNFFEGENNGKGSFMVNDVNIGGGATCVTFQGTGDNCRMYTYSEDYPTSNAGNILVRYDIGSAETWGQAPNQTYTWFSKSGAFTNTNTEALAIDNGVFVSQARGAGNNVKGCPGFAYMDNDGNVLFNSASIEDLTSCGTGIAITKDLKTFAVSDPANAGISFFSVAWDGNTPSMTKLYSVKATAAASEHCQMTFDRAGNLHVFARGYGYQMFSVVNPAPVATTPARKALVIKASASGVENVTTDREATLSVYPNPATDIVTVNAGDEIATLAVYSLTGAQMGVDAQVNGSTATLNVSGLQTGAYILSVNGKTTKLIKR